MAKNIINFRPQLIVYDFDGVMTNNKIVVLENGIEGVIANRSDGWGVKKLRDAGYFQIIISTEKNRVVTARAKKLKILAIQGCDDKKSCLEKICQRKKINLKKVLYIGNDVNDLPAMRIAGFSVAPADAEQTVLKSAHFVTMARGGEGVIREVSNFILKNESH